MSSKFGLWRSTMEELLNKGGEMFGHKIFQSAFCSLVNGTGAAKFTTSFGSIFKANDGKVKLAYTLFIQPTKIS